MNTKPTYTVRQSIAYIFRNIWQHDRGYLAVMAIEALCAVAAPFLGIYLPKIAIELVSRADATAWDAVTQLGGVACALFVVFLLQGFAQGARGVRDYILRLGYMLRVFKKTLFCDYDWLESEHGRNEYH
jgi:hypothetical protein